jgi:two-component system OmpR family sensor kinase
MRRQPVDLLAIAADTIRDAHARVPDRPVRLAVLGPADGEFEPVTVLGDEHRLRQVATNLVSNALQHTPPGTQITVRVGRLDAAGAIAEPVRTAVERAGQDGPTSTVRPTGWGDVATTARTTGWGEIGPATLRPAGPLAVLEVADDGPGIPAEHASRIFERLYRVDPSRTRTPGVGSGLGLSIVAAIVQSHGGWVELVTTQGRGAVFRVLLPVVAEPGGPGSQRAPR